ncbi:DNA-nicking endonuclease, Smr domain [Fulvimarina manganoxydans]|uniref:DNA-nicking endonuclease, Smr domain n=1 Tax=Fulvimarina manganoxydans TaxID=937218 RepID=A0A1W2EBM2_9HYPH|nr:Smr/MutS family protein [Fulvimarina manganoxydans]MEE2950893.1 Smr/MutS family protein [Pseudomonadota bacterium]SMD07065.1 DNA-nicking endonuclease, Smr domain [Fulvimarina manganoxydans]
MKRRKKTLSEEDRRLWASVARTAMPLKGKALPEVPEAPAEPVPPQPAPQAKSKAQPPAVASSPASRLAPARLQAVPLRPQPLERLARRKLAKGKLKIEARIDLHDMTQTRAHDALAGFLRQAQGMGLRHVLVITGRGSPGGPRGILRRMVPLWFSSPDFRGLVSHFEAAERHHGGDGALYVRVRRPS